jgi:hypothetical protein
MRLWLRPGAFLPITYLKKSKEPHSLVLMTNSDADKAPVYSIPGVSYSLHIDRISVVLKPPSTAVAKAVSESVYAYASDHTVLASLSGQHSASGRYKLERHIPIQGTTRRIFFQFGPKSDHLPWCRLEFNPRKIAKEGGDLVAALGGIFPDGWDFVLENGRATRLDVLLRMQGVRMDDFNILVGGGLTTQLYRQDGLLQTFYAGKKKGSFTKIYSKSAQRKAQGKPLSVGTVHVERTIRNPPNGSLMSLGDLPNPFLGLALVANVLGPPPYQSAENERLWSVFCDSVKVRGLKAALDLTPSKRRTIYRAHLKTLVSPWWDPTAFWNDWPKALQEIGFNA